MIKHYLIRLTILSVLLTFLIPTTSLSTQDRRIALVIGNGAYKSSPLRNPVNDATDIANALRNLGFSVILKTNANQRTMEDSIRDFGKKLRLGGVGLFYFAGHGMQVKGRNYLIPIAAGIYEETEIKYEAVDAGRVLDAIDNAGNMLNIVIIDACRDNPFARSFRSSTSGLARMDAPKGTLIAYSTSPGKVALDGNRRNSPYTEALLKYIQVPDLTIEQVFKQTRKDIDILTDGKQSPWESTSLTGDFFFNPERGIVIAKPSLMKIQDSAELDQKRVSKRNLKNKPVSFLGFNIDTELREGTLLPGFTFKYFGKKLFGVGISYSSSSNKDEDISLKDEGLGDNWYETNKHTMATLDIIIRLDKYFNTQDSWFLPYAFLSVGQVNIEGSYWDYHETYGGDGYRDGYHVDKASAYGGGFGMSNLAKHLPGFGICGEINYFTTPDFQYIAMEDVFQVSLILGYAW